MPVIDIIIVYGGILFGVNRMLKFTDIKYLPVIDASTGRKIGFVKDVLIVPATKEIKGFIISCKNLLYYFKAIKIEHIITIGKHAVLIKDIKYLISLKHFFLKVGEVKRYSDVFIEKQVYTDGGEKIGSIQDALFDFETATLAEFEISDGLIQDLIEGRRVIEAKEIIQLEKGIVMLGREKLKQLKQKHKGLKNLLGERKGKNE